MLQRSDTIKERAQGRWPDILVNLGIDAKALVNRHGPCPVCGGKDRFRFDDRQGRGDWICNQCGAGDGLRLVMLFRGAAFKEALDLVDQALGGATLSAPCARPRQPSSKLSWSDQQARLIWRGARRVADGDPVATYLRRRCGNVEVPPSIRFAPDLKHVAADDRKTVSYHPAMAALFQDHDGNGTGITRCWLTPDGHKAGVTPDRGMLGHMAAGGAVRLMPHGDVLGIAEGIETAFSAAKLFGVPCWAALDAGRLEVWQPPADVTRVIIFADHDENQRGQDAATRLEQRLNDGGMLTQVRWPDRCGEDWNDVLVGAAKSSPHFIRAAAAGKVTSMHSTL